MKGLWELHYLNESSVDDDVVIHRYDRSQVQGLHCAACVLYTRL